MGAEQSTPDDAAAAESNVGGFSRNVPQPKRKAHKKIVVTPAAEPEDEYFKHANVTDRILPIYNEPASAASVAQELDDATVDVAGLMAELNISGQKDESDELEDAEALNAFDEASSSDDENADDEGDRGMFHREVREVEKKEITVFDGEAHPIEVRGTVAVGSVLALKDLSPWRQQFPVHTVHWSVSDSLDSQHTFRPESVAIDRKLTVDGEWLGRYLQVRVVRHVERQIKDTLAEDDRGGAFDPHVRRARKAERGTEVVQVAVETRAVVGPVLLNDTWAATLLQSLAANAFQLAVRLHDGIDAAGGKRRADDGAASSKSAKIPAFVSVNTSTFDVHYVVSAEDYEKTRQRRVLTLEWLQYVLGFGGGGGSSSKGAAPPVGNVVASLPLKRIAVRPAKENTKTLILALGAEKRKKDSGNDDRAPEELIRFDVDPKVGRPLALAHLLAFQGAGAVEREVWEEVALEGDVAVVKDFVQKRLEDLSTVVDVDAPPFTSLPLTPWAG